MSSTIPSHGVADLALPEHSGNTEPENAVAPKLGEYSVTVVPTSEEASLRLRAITTGVSSEGIESHSEHTIKDVTGFSFYRGFKKLLFALRYFYSSYFGVVSEQKERWKFFRKRENDYSDSGLMIRAIEDIVSDKIAAFCYFSVVFGYRNEDGVKKMEQTFLKEQLASFTQEDIKFFCEVVATYAVKNCYLRDRSYHRPIAELAKDMLYNPSPRVSNDFSCVVRQILREKHEIIQKITRFDSPHNQTLAKIANEFPKAIIAALMKEDPAFFEQSREGLKYFLQQAESSDPSIKKALRVLSSERFDNKTLISNLNKLYVLSKMGLLGADNEEARLILEEIETSKRAVFETHKSVQLLQEEQKEIFSSINDTKTSLTRRIADFCQKPVNDPEAVAKITLITEALEEGWATLHPAITRDEVENSNAISEMEDKRTELFQAAEAMEGILPEITKDVHKLFLLTDQSQKKSREVLRAMEGAAETRLKFSTESAACSVIMRAIDPRLLESTLSS